MQTAQADSVEHIAARKRLQDVPQSGLSGAYIEALEIADVYRLLGEFDRGRWPPRQPRMRL
jgi:hypothetical protein